jgi:hypothetical protein
VKTLLTLAVAFGLVAAIGCNDNKTTTKSTTTQSRAS